MLKTDYAVVLTGRTPLDVIRSIERDTEIRIAMLKRILRRAIIDTSLIGNLKELRRLRRQLNRYEYDEREKRGRFTLVFETTDRR